MGRIPLRLLLSMLLLLAVVAGGAPAGAIIEGDDAEDGDWPAMVAIITQDGGLVCGGTAISAVYVLTAAHCFYDARSGGVPEDAGPFAVVLGGADLDNESALRIGVAAVVLHPGYDELRMINDIAVLRLRQPFPFDPQALADPDEPELWAPGRTATVLGYGATEIDGSDHSDHLREASVPITVTEDCVEAYDGVDPSRQICAGEPGTEDEPGSGACHGDSGGPLLTHDAYGAWIQVGVVSYGGLCGVEHPAVYVQVAAYRGWIDDVTSRDVGEVPPDEDNPAPAEEGAAAAAFRVADGATTEAISQAAAVSAMSFLGGESQHAVLARADVYADALGGSSLGWGTGPLLFTGAGGGLPEETRTELLRVVEPGGVVYVLGGSAAVPAGVDAEVEALGFEVVRLAGAGREATAAIVADEVVEAIGDGAVPLDTMILATSRNWPDAVTAGQLGSWWGMPILLTSPGELHPEARAVLERHRPGAVLVVGGTAAVSDRVASEVAATGAEVVRLGGATRTETAAMVLSFQMGLFEAMGEEPPAYGVVVNLRRSDAYAHVLSASMVTGAFAGVFLPLEGEGGTVLTPDVAAAACGLDLSMVVAGSTDLVSEEGVEAVRDALLGRSCS